MVSVSVLFRPGPMLSVVSYSCSFSRLLFFVGSSFLVLCVWDVLLLVLSIWFCFCFPVCLSWPLRGIGGLSVIYVCTMGMFVFGSSIVYLFLFSTRSHLCGSW